MTEDVETEIVDWFGNFGISKRLLLTLPKKDIKIIKDELEKSFIQKSAVNQLMKGFIKKETVEQNYIKREEVEKNYIPISTVETDYIKRSSIESEGYIKFVFPEMVKINCRECHSDSMDIFVDENGNLYKQKFCMSCGFDLTTPSPQERKRKYEKTDRMPKKTRSGRIYKRVGKK